MIKKYESFVSDNGDHCYDYDEIVVAKETYDGLIKGHKYIVQEMDTDNQAILVKDIINNQPFYRHKDRFVTEMEYEIGQDLKNYNL